MMPEISSAQGKLIFEQHLPDSWNMGLLPGSQAFSYAGQAGYFAIQTMQTDRFSIWYAAGQLSPSLKLKWIESPLLRLQFMLRGNLFYQHEGRKKIRLRTGSTNAVWDPGCRALAHTGSEPFEILQVKYEPFMVRELVENFPEEYPFAAETRKFRIAPEKNGKLHALLDNPYSGNTLKFFYRIEASQYLLDACRLTQNRRLRYTEEIIERIYKIDNLILSNLDQHYTNADLAKKAHMPEPYLLETFREIIGMTMFDRHKQARMEKAKEYLLQTDLPVKEFYSQVGFSSYTGFINAFTDHFHFTPMEYREKFRAFD